MTNSFKIVVGKTPSASHIFLNGVELTGVRRLSFELDGAASPDGSLLKLELYGEAVLDGEYVEVPLVKGRTATQT